jgi:hypothetical protein
VVSCAVFVQAAKLFHKREVFEFAAYWGVRDGRHIYGNKYEREE